MKKRKVKQNKPYQIPKPIFLGGILMFFVVTGFFINQSRTYQPKKQEATSKVKTYTSEKLGYAISYPSSWVIEGSQNSAPAEIITNQTKDVMFSVQHIVGDGRLLKSSGVETVMNEIENSYRSDEKYTIQSLNKILWKGLPALYTTGSFNDKTGLWDFEEYSIFYGGEIYNLKINVKPEVSQKYTNTIKNTVNSFKIIGYNVSDSKSINGALGSVMNVVEVKNFQKDVFENNRSTFNIVLDRDPKDTGSYYVIAVFELFPDHRTTFNRYRVSQDDGKIYRYDAVSDGWDKL